MERTAAWLLVCALVLGAVPGVAAGCDDAAVVVVVSVLATLAVVAVVLGIIGVMLWKRRRAVGRPMKLESQGGDSEPSSPDAKFAYSNPAFDKGPADPEKAEGVAGVPCYVACRDGSPSPLKSKAVATKTWSSLPRPTETRYRRESTGSLDRHSGTGDADIVGVWLHSQDFVGLGFNITGSMRDGIYVSQVHNRGPANESGQFKVGDRILSATISFENMVYEDALTILSYASPYPVKICLQKQEQMPKSRRLSDSRTNLNHPLYRSQSLNTLINIGKQSVFHPKRCNSEMRYDKRDSPKLRRIAITEGNIAEEVNVTPAKSDNNVSPVSQAPVTVHKTQSPRYNNKQKHILFQTSVDQPTDLPNATVDLNNVNTAQSNKSDQIDRGGLDEIDGVKSPDFSNVFDTLNEQDKLDMIRLSYAEPNESKQPLTPVFIKCDTRNVPVKPERKNKRSSTASTASMSDTDLPSSTPSSPTTATVDDTMFVTPLVPPTEAPPPVPEDDSEADEVPIMPEVKSRIVSVDTHKIQFEQVTFGGLDVSDISADRTVMADTDADSSMSDMDTTLVKSPVFRPESPEPVDEEAIASTQIHKGEIEIPNFLKSSTKGSSKQNTGEQCDSLSSSSSSSDESRPRIDKLKGNDDQNHEFDNDVKKIPETDVEKDFPHLDMNLNFNADSVLYKDTFPNRNTKQAGSGVAYDISVEELSSIENKILEQRAERENQTGKHGIAFEIRDDLINGIPQTVTTHSVHRTASYDSRKINSNSSDNEILSHRPTSLKEQPKKDSEVKTSTLDWSGQRLVRSGSFSEIPQDDSVKDWTNNQNLNADDAIFEQHIQEDSVSSGLEQLKNAKLFQASDNLADLSDSDSHCRSISSSASSVSNSPRVETGEFKNGNEDDIGVSLETSPAKISPPPESKADLITSIAKYGSHDEVFTVTLKSPTDTDA